MGNQNKSDIEQRYKVPKWVKDLFALGFTVLLWGIALYVVFVALKKFAELLKM